MKEKSYQFWIVEHTTMDDTNWSATHASQIPTAEHVRAKVAETTLTPSQLFKLLASKDYSLSLLTKIMEEGL